MQIGETKLDFGEIGYPGYYAVVQRSVKEGFIYGMSRLAGTGDETDMTAQSTAARTVNIRFLELVRDWNLTDDDDRPLTLVKNITAIDGESEDELMERKGAIVAEVPVDIIRHIADQVTATARAKDRVKDF